MSELTSNQAKNNIKNNNPEGKGGFKEHPENRSNGRWSKENSKTYWLHYFDGLTFEEFIKYPDEHPEMTMAAKSSYARIEKQVRDLKEFQEVANRTEGMPRQTIKQEFDDNVTEIEYHLKRGQDETQTGGD